MFQKVYLLAVVGLGALILAGCGPGVASSTATPLAPTPGAGGTVIPAPTTATGATPAGATATSAPASPVAMSTAAGDAGTPTIAAASSPSPAGAATASPAAGSAAPTGSASVNIKVTAFSVWQNFMPGPGTASPPLLASVEFDVTNTGKTALQNVMATHLVVRRGDGTTALDADVQGGAANMRPGGLTPGTSLHYSVQTGPVPVTSPMTENEAVTGSLTVSVEGQTQLVPLPPTRVLFVH